MMTFWPPWKAVILEWSVGVPTQLSFKVEYLSACHRKYGLKRQHNKHFIYGVWTIDQEM